MSSIASSESEVNADKSVSPIGGADVRCGVAGTSGRYEQELIACFATIREELATRAGSESFMRTEKWVWTEILKLGAALMTWALALAHERLPTEAKEKRGRACFVRQRAKKRSLKTLFGGVTYVRDYMHRVTGKGGGYFPLDEALGEFG